MTLTVTIERQRNEAVLVQHTAPLKDVWEKLVTQQQPILFVVDDNGLFYGALTKGDLAKGANGGKESNEDGLDPFSAGAMCNRQAKKLPVEASDEEVLTIMSSKITCIPLIDEQGKLVSMAQKAGKAG